MTFGLVRSTGASTRRSTPGTLERLLHPLLQRGGVHLEAGLLLDLLERREVHLGVLRRPVDLRCDALHQPADRRPASRSTRGGT